MNGVLSDDQRFLRDRTLEVAAVLAADRTERPGGDPSAWRVLVEAGFSAVLSDASVSTLDVAVMAEAFGRELCPVPFVGTAVLAAGLLRHCPSGAELLEATGRGDLAPAVALDEGLLSVADPAKSRRVVAWDATMGGTVLAVDRAASSLLAAAGDDGRPLDGVDPGRALVAHDGLEWRVVGPFEPGALERWEAFARIMLAAEMVGLMDASTTAAAGYASDRIQFGRPIGSFQAVQHMCADALVGTETSRSAVYASADLFDDGEVVDAAKAAKAYCSQHVRDVVETSLQVHGGMGMTWEFSGHRYLRRALLDRLTLGDEIQLTDDVGAALVARAHADDSPVAALSLSPKA